MWKTFVAKCCFLFMSAYKFNCSLYLFYGKGFCSA